MTDLLSDLIGRVVWPIAVLLIVLLFRRQVAALFPRVSGIEVDAAGKKVKIELARRVLGHAADSEARSDTSDADDASPERHDQDVAQAIETIIALSSTQAKIVRSLEDRAVSRSEISRRLVALFGSETRSSQVHRQLDELVSSGLVRGSKAAPATSTD